MRGRLTKTGFESAAGLSLLMLSACSGEAIDPSAAPDPSVALDSETSPAEPSLAGTWTATVSSPAFVSNPKQLRLELDTAGRGTLLVGAERLPVPSDPAVSSPPEALSDAGEATGMLLHLYEGVEYSLVHVQKGSGGLSFALDALEAFEPVCAQAVPLLTDVGYRCLENWGGSVERSAA